MKDYFRRIVDRKICRNEPLFFYHHPGDGSPDVVDDLFTCVREFGIRHTTLAGYAHWWKKREEARFNLEWIDKTIRIADNVADASVRLEVLTPDGFSSVVPLNSREVSRSRGEWMKVCSYTPPVDLIRTREFDVRTFLAKWYNFFLRKFR
jgi:hypothetical protein